MGDRRARLLVAGLFCWAALACARHGWLAAHERERLLAAGAELAWRQVTIPAARGRILDRDGQPLAWTERRCALWLRSLPADSARRRRLAEALAGFLGEAPPRLARDQCLRRYLAIDDLLHLRPVLEAFPELSLEPSLRRVAVDYPAVRQRLGAVAVADDGTMSGRSGWELRHERRLRGEDGAFLVMCDRHGNWLAGTWRETAPMRPGQDVRVDASLAELRGDGAAPDAAGEGGR